MELESNRIIPLHNVISYEYENDIISNVYNIQLVNKNIIKERTVFRYGNTPYKSNIVDIEYPTFLKELCDKLIILGILEKIPNSITINIYNIGDYIIPHIDMRECGEVITILSLLGEAKMTMEYKDNSFDITLPSKSVVQLKDEYRHMWLHYIKKVENKRISIVFR